MSTYQTETETKKRIRIACDTCRRKKIKCNGTQPCSNCVQGDLLNCHYAERSAKKKTCDGDGVSKRRNSTNKTLKTIETRLSRLENVLSRLTTHLDHLSGAPPSHLNGAEDTKSSFLKNTPDDDSLTGSGNEDHEDRNETDEENSAYDHPENGVASDTVPTREPSELPHPEGSKDFKNTVDSRTMEQFFGTHSIMCIFSSKSLDWVDQIIGPESIPLTTAIRELPVHYFKSIRPLMLKWIESPNVDSKERKRLHESPFPNDPDLIFSFIESYYYDIHLINFICDPDYIIDLFKKYYKNKEPGCKRTNKFKYSEYLIMTSALLLMISAKLDLDKTNNALAEQGLSADKGVPPRPAPELRTERKRLSEMSRRGISSLTNNEAREKNRKVGSAMKYDPNNAVNHCTKEELTKLQDQLLNNAIYYYHRVSVMSDGIDTIRAILTLIIYTENNVLTNHVNNVLIAVAVRFALEIGLHRSETYSGLPFERQEKERRVWWLLQFYDMEICFRSAKPPSINENDVTTHNPEDLKQFTQLWRESAYFDPNDSCNPHDHDFGSNEQLSMVSHGDDHMLFYYLYLLKLTKLRSKSYNMLFIASSQSESYESIYRKLDVLNQEMFESADLMSDKDRPRFYNDPEFKLLPADASISQRETTLGVQLTYFLHLMLMNRLAFVMGNGDEKYAEKNIQLRNISLNSARTILVLVTQVNKTNTVDSFFNWILFFPMSAFFNIAAAIFSHPDSPEALTDIQLLVDCSINYFESIHTRLRQQGPDYSVKDELVYLIINQILQLTIKIYEKKHGVSLTENNPVLRKHIEETSKYCPLLNATKADGYKSAKTTIIHGESQFKNSQFNSGFTSVASSPSAAIAAKPAATSAIDYSQGLTPALSNLLHPSSDPGIRSNCQAMADRDINQTWGKFNNGYTSNARTPATNYAITGLPPASQHYNSTFTSPQGVDYSMLRNGINGIGCTNTNSPVRMSTTGESVSSAEGVGSNEEFTDYFNDDVLSSMLFSQINRLPNYFYDSNLE